MSPERETAAALRRALRDVAKDQAAIAARAREIETYLAPDEERPPERASALALTLHFYYTAFESLIERIIRVIDGALPRDDGWHVALLREAAEPLPRVRPPLIDPDDLEDWHQLLKFRHFLRNAYRVALDWDRLVINGRRALRLEGRARETASRAIDLIEHALSAIESPSR